MVNGESKSASLVRLQNAKESMGWELIVIIELFQLKKYKKYKKYKKNYLQKCKNIV